MTCVRRLALLVVAALVGLTAGTGTAAADVVPVDPRLTWQTNGGLDALLKNPTGAVYATVLGTGASAGRVFLGGTFSSLKPPRGISGAPVTRAGVAAIDIATGQLVEQFDAGLAVAGASPEIRALALSADGATLYIGGRFDTAGSQARRNVAAVDAVTGAVTGFRANAGAVVKALAVTADRVYLGGDFNAVNGKPRLKLAAVATGTGALVESFAPAVTQETGKPCPPRCVPSVNAFGLTADGATLYVGGTFAFVGGVPRNSAAAVRTVDGAVTPWDPNVYHAALKSSLNKVYSLQLYGDRVFLCGDFYRVRGTNHPNVAGVDAATGAILPGFVVSTDGAVNACRIAPESGVLYLGGHFDKAGGEEAGRDLPGVQPRRHIAKVDPVTGDVLPWNAASTRQPNVNSKAGVYAIDAARDRVVLGGQFTLVNWKDQQGIAVFG